MRRQERRKKQSELEAALSSYEQQFPTDSNEIAATRNGERQLLGLSVDHLILGLLLTTDIYRLNRCLRSGDTMEGGPGPMMDWRGYESHQRFFDDAMRMFERIGSDLDLDEPIEVFRGVGIPPANAWETFDLWGIRAHLESGNPWQPTVVEDPGFMFASPSEAFAESFDGSDANRIASEWRVVCMMEIRSGLCIPDPIYRTPELMRRLHNKDFLSGAGGQVIIPPVSQWRITDVVPDHITKTVRVRMQQLV